MATSCEVEHDSEKNMNLEVRESWIQILTLTPRKDMFLRKYVFFSSLGLISSFEI